VVLISGAGRGIGRAIARTFGGAGARLALNYASDDNAAESLGQDLDELHVEHSFYRGSVTDEAFINTMVADVTRRFGPVDCLVNNAGIIRDNYLALMSDGQWDDVMNVNLRSVFLLTRRVIKPMIARRSGSIINLSSQNALHGREGQTNYSAAKAGLLGLTRSLAREVGRYNVRVNAIVTGVIDTDMTRRLPSKTIDLLRERIPLGRLGRPEEVANLALYLATDLASFQTGGCIEVTGGF